MYEIFSKLLQEFNVTPYKVSKETGVSQSTLSDWKRGISTPKQDKLQKLADYFNVSLEYLMTGKEKEGGEVYYLNEETRKVAQDIFENKELRMLFDAARDAEPEDLEAVHTMLMALKRKERGHIDD
ncbi:XRE family transcriptional regulator [Faecalicatena contorta]|jgi:transcriptional regulator with XRE-family HTH domain|uniref:helix-turn-helix domain-containing protein n=1 Tax=Faecalicatena contorta TaxID=39482 RepID=UPI00046F9E9E|nr:helix-turn-helix transcriptional regulator [Faecalicatena contorta]MRM91262.1 XRE family transcriptional regulator [Faecalicatena contorta]